LFTIAFSDVYLFFDFMLFSLFEFLLPQQSFHVMKFSSRYWSQPLTTSLVKKRAIVVPT